MNAPADSTKVPRGCAWTIVVVGVLLLVMGAISVIAMPKLWKMSQEVWTETHGTLVESYLKESEYASVHERGGRDWRTTYQVRLKYRYMLDGRELHGDEKALRQPEEDENQDKARVVRDSYKAGEAIAVYYDPDKPTRSRFTAREPGVEFKKDLLLMIVYLLGGWGMFVWGRKLLR